MSPHSDLLMTCVYLRQYQGIRLTNRRNVQNRLCLHVLDQREEVVRNLSLRWTLPEAQLVRCCLFPARPIQVSHCFVFPVQFALPEPEGEVGGFPWTESCGAQALASAPFASPDQKTSASTLRLPLVREIDVQSHQQLTHTLSIPFSTFFRTKQLTSCVLERLSARHCIGQHVSICLL